MTKMQPVAWRVLVKPDDIEEKSEGGIVLAVDKKLEKGARITGVIVGIGEDVYPNSILPKAGLHVGDRVYYAKYAGKTVLDNETGEELVILNDEDIVAKDVDSD